MLVNATKSAIQAYARDLADRGQDGAQPVEADALFALLGIFKGLSRSSFESFCDVGAKIDVQRNNPPLDDELMVGQALLPLERLVGLMGTISTANRRRDMQSFVDLLQRYESVSITKLVNAVQCTRRGRGKRPSMSLEDLKKNLDAALGDDEKFNRMLDEVRLLNDDDFEDVAKTVLRVAFKTKKQGIERLIRLHNSTRAHRLKQRPRSRRHSTVGPHRGR